MKIKYGKNPPKRPCFFCVSVPYLPRFIFWVHQVPRFFDLLPTPVARIEHAEGPSEGGCHGLPGENTDVNVGPETKPKTLRFENDKIHGTHTSQQKPQLFFGTKKKWCTLTNVASQ